MPESFQRLLLMSDPDVLGLNEQAALGPVRPPQRSQFSHLFRHFLERFFNHETASPDGDAKARLILVALATGLPGFMVAIYLWPVYHAFIAIPRPHSHVAWVPGPPPYWVQVNQHFFFVLYSFAALGIATVFEWDLFFPDLLDVFVLKTLPVPGRRLFFARVAAMAVLIAGFLFDANVLATVALPAAIDPPSLPRFLAGHVLAVGGAGLFAAAFIVALEGVLLSALGERLFRKVSLLLQALFIAFLLVLVLLFPVYSGATPVLLQSRAAVVFWLPPFWFLGVYQRLMQGPTALPVYTELARTACIALAVTAGVAVLTYPLAYLRREHRLVEGLVPRRRRSPFASLLDGLLHAVLVRSPRRRAVFHFISQTLLRVPRYRIYLVLYGSVGLSVIAATVLRFQVVHGQMRASVSAFGIRAAAAIAAFWVVAGLQAAFVSSGNRQGNWIFRIVDGRPPLLRAALEELRAAQHWTLLWAGIVTLATVLALRTVAPSQLLTWPATASQLLVAAGLCLLFTDGFFLGVTTVAFTGEPSRQEPNLAFTVFKYFIFFPPLLWFPSLAEQWIERSPWRFAAAAAVIAALHVALRLRHRQAVKEFCQLQSLDDGEESPAFTLGLRHGSVSTG